MMDRIREEMAKCGNLRESVRRAISTTGMAISFTALTLMAGIIMWVIFSNLRFQSDAALLLCVMIVINGIAAMLLVPSWVLVFKPRFIANVYADEDGILHADQQVHQQTPSPTDNRQEGDGYVAGATSRP
jgi:hypothetical protein